MSRAPDVPRLVNFSDSDVSSASESEGEGKDFSSQNKSSTEIKSFQSPVEFEESKISERSDRLKQWLDDPKYSKWLTDKPGDSKYNRDKPGVSKGGEKYEESRSGDRLGHTKYGDPSGSRDRRSNSRGRRSRSRGRRSGSRGKRSRSRGRRSGSRGRSHSRGRSGSRGRRSRSRSRDKYRRSRSGSRGRYRRSRSGSRGRHRRSHSGSRRRKDRRYNSPRRQRRNSPPRAHRTLDTLEKLGIELKPPPVEEQQPPIPSYYNKMAVNPAKYAQQMAKRKLIWGSKNTEEGTTKASSWQGATFSQDQDGKMTAKFKRLMGIKQEGEVLDTVETQGQELIKRQQELFSSMELQYEAARQATHTQRGVGLGFSTHPHHFP